MKILHINSVCGVKSTGRICTDIADILSANGDECRIAYGRDTVPEKYKSIAVRIGTPSAVKRHILLSRLFGKTAFYSASATKRFLNWVDTYKPDVIHLHNLHGYYIHIGLLFKYIKKHNIPVVWTLHDCWPFTGHCSHFASVNCNQWQTACVNCVKKKSYPTCWLWENVKKNYNTKKQLLTSLSDLTLVAPSQWLADVAGNSFLGKYPIKLVNNGIDLSVFKPTQGDFRDIYNINNKKMVLGVASAWGTNKGLGDLVRLSKLLPKEYQVVLVGLTKAQAADIPDNIICIERTDNVKQLAQIYTAADVFVNPSIEETMGLVTVEALACGTPCVVYNATAVPEAVDESCGVVVPAGDVNGLCKAITDVAESGRYTWELCVQRAQKYDKATQFAAYTKLYRRLGCR